MKKQVLNQLLMVVGLTLSGAAMAAGNTSSNAVYATENANGTVELSNISAIDNQEPVVAVPEPALATATDGEATATPAESARDPREQYRDKMLQSGEGVAAINPAVNRRYKKVDYETYRATVLGIAPQSPQ